MLKLINLKLLLLVVISQLDLTSSLSLLDPPEKHGPRKIERYTHHVNVSLDAAQDGPPQTSRDDDSTTSRTKRSSPQPEVEISNVDVTETSNQLLIHWAGQDVILLLAKDIDSTDSKTVSGSTMYFSYNYGKSFQPKITTNAKYLSAIPKMIKGWVNQYESVPGNHEYFVMTDSFNKVIYVTLDAGKTIQTVGDLLFHPDKVVMHPLYPHLVIALDQTDTDRDLYLSEDQGFTWRKIQTSVKSAYWGYNPEILQTADEARALYVERTEGSLITVLKTHDFNQFVPVISNVLEFVMANDTMFALTTSHYNATAKDLWIAPSRVEAFSKVVFNGYRRDSFRDYIIVDSSESQVLVIALGETAAHLFMSEPNMVDFTLSIENVRRVQESYRPSMRPEPRPYDVYKVVGMRSVFIINVEKEQNRRTNVVTLITFDKGAIWQQIPTPTMDSHGNPYISNSTLELFQSQTYDLPHFVAVSSSSAPGYLLAEGAVVSPHVTPRPNAAFFSSDGGRVFREIMSGSYHMVWVDHGGAIALISKYQTTEVMWISVNGGVNWTRVVLSEKKLRIYGMLTEPGETSTIITVFGSATASLYEDFMWTIVQVDVKNLLGDACSDADYQSWTMSDENGDNCIMGTRDVYQRRIMKNVCMNKISYDRPKTSEVCPCRRKDFECDVGYIKMPQRSFHPCQPDGLTPIDQVPPTCKPGTLYSKSNGYRKLAGDKCSGGQEEYLSPRAEPCPFVEEQSFLAYSVYGAPASAEIRIYNLLTKSDKLWFAAAGLATFDFDFATNCVFYALNDSPGISRRCFNQLLATPWKVVVSSPSGSNPVSLAFDWLAGNLYWASEDGRLSVCDREGQAIRTFNFTAKAASSGLVYNATHIVLDPSNRAMYTSHFNAAEQRCGILRQSMDGRGELTPVFYASCASPRALHSLVYDYESGTLFWVYNHTVKAFTNTESGLVHVANIVDSVDISDRVPVAVFKNKLLIGSSGGIWESEKFQSDDVTTVDFGLNVRNIRLMKTFSKRWQTSATDPCKGRKCKHLCLLGRNENKTSCMCGNAGGMTITVGADNQEVCACPIGQVLSNGFCTSPDGDSCTPNVEFRCAASGRCIPSSKVCDGDNNCPDGSDESDCSFCSDENFQCQSTQLCIPKIWACDGESDCEDGSDERGCSEKNCTSDQFKCHTSGACIAGGFHCDGEVDCDDESDELGCIDTSTNDDCWSSEFQCPPGNHTSSSRAVCISFEQICDGVADCPNGDDELPGRCHRPNKTCHEIEFRCDNGRCIYDWLYCNGVDNCGDGSDEKNCTSVPSTSPTPVDPMPNQCPNGHLRCRSSGHCYPLQWACDGIDDCGDSSDEFDCEQSTNHTTGMLVPCYPTFSQFKCKTGDKCIFLHLKCDGDNDCLDWSDEKDCADFKRADSSECVINSGIGYKGTRNYTKNGYRCQRWDTDTPHEPHYRPLDEHNNFCRNPDNDAIGPWCYTTSPQQRWDYCAIPYCSNSTTGAPTDHVPTRNPETVYCPDGYISCGGNESSNCILSRFACDGEKDCANGSDEEYCHAEVCDTSNGKFKCANGLCISGHLKCNGYDDCDDNSDEQNCPIKCLFGSFRCRHETDKCIERRRLCDGVRDCSDGSDEYCARDDDNAVSDSFACSTSGKKVKSAQVCDFHPDCGDQSDESNCMCSYGYETFPVSDGDAGGVLVPKTVKRKVKVDCRSKPHDSYLVYLYYEPVEEGDGMTNFTKPAMMKFTKYPYDNYFTITNLDYNRRYCFALAYRINGITLPPTVPENSLQQRCFHTPEGVPDAPTNIHFAQEADRRRVVLVWDRPEVTNGKITKYAIKVSVGQREKTLIKESTGLKEESYELERMGFFDTKITASVAAYTAAGRGEFSDGVDKNLMSRRESLLSTPSKITRTCMTLSWHPPPSAGSSFAGQYLICLKSQWNQTTLTSPGNVTTKQICLLAPGESYSVIVTRVEKGEVGILDCADEKFHRFTTVAPRVDTPSIDVNQSHATGVDSVQLVWSNMNDPLNKTKVVYQIQYGSNVQRSSLHDTFVSGNTAQISKLRHNAHSVFRVRIVQPFVGRWGEFVTILPMYDHTAAPRDLSVTADRKGGYIVSWISPYDDNQLAETYMLLLLNKDSGQAVSNISVPCRQLRCSYVFNSIRDYALFEAQVSLVQKDGTNGTMASINFFTGIEVDPIDDLHLYRDDINSATLLYHLPERFKDFYRDHVSDVKVLLCKSTQDDKEEGCVHEPQLNISSHQITIKGLQFNMSYHVHLKPECQHKVDQCPRESHLSFTFGEFENLRQLNAASGKPLGQVDIISIAVSSSVVLVMIVGIVAYLMRRRRRQSVNYVGMTSRYNSQSGEAFFVADDAPFNGGLLDDEVDTPMISGFNDDEPLIVA